MRSEEIKSKYKNILNAGLSHEVKHKYYTSLVLQTLIAILEILEGKCTSKTSTEN